MELCKSMGVMIQLWRIAQRGITWSDDGNLEINGMFLAKGHNVTISSSSPY